MNIYLKLSLTLLLLLFVFVAHRTNTGGTIASPQGGFFFIKNELSTQFRFHIDTVYRRSNINRNNYPNWNKRYYANDYQHCLILKADNQSVLLQAVTYQFHYLNLIPILLFYLSFICLMIWFYRQNKPIIFFLFLTISYGTVLGIEYYRANQTQLMFSGLIEGIMLCIWFCCVVVGAIILCFMNKTKFNKLFFWLQIILSSLLFVFICYHFIDVNINNAAEIKIEQANEKAEMELKEDLITDPEPRAAMPVEAPKKSK
jgi:hypothetical protein